MQVTDQTDISSCYGGSHRCTTQGSTLCSYHIVHAVRRREAQARARLQRQEHKLRNDFALHSFAFDAEPPARIDVCFLLLGKSSSCPWSHAVRDAPGFRQGYCVACAALHMRQREVVAASGRSGKMEYRISHPPFLNPSFCCPVMRVRHSVPCCISRLV